MPFNPTAFGSAYAGGVDSASGGTGAFNAAAFGSGFFGGVDSIAGTGGAFDFAAFDDAFYVGSGSLPSSNVPGALVSGRPRSSSIRLPRIASTYRTARR